MHDGSLATLRDVVEFYDAGGHANSGLDPEIRKLNLLPEEKRALIEFMTALSGKLPNYTQEFRPSVALAR